MNRIWNLSACAAIALCAAPAAAQSERAPQNGTSFRYVQVTPTPRPAFTPSGVITPQLAMSKRSSTVRMFDLIDRDRDGKLSDAELSSTAAVSSDWVAMDTDGNGHITLAEFTALRPPPQIASSMR
jgi:hypothetical protein